MEINSDPYQMLYRSFSRIVNLSKFSNIEITFNNKKALFRHKFSQPTILEFNMNDDSLSIVCYEGIGKDILDEIRKDIGHIIKK